MADEIKPKTETQVESCPIASGKDVSGEHWRFCLQCGHELIKINVNILTKSEYCHITP